MSQLNKLITLLALVAALLLGYVAAGPYLAYSAIRDAVQTKNTAKLARHVDFPVLRRNLKLQLDDYLARRAGPERQASMFGALAVRVASGVAGGAVDTMVTPAGLGALLEGRTVWHRLTGGGGTHDVYAPAPPANPLRDARYRYRSPSRFTATVPGEDGAPVEFVLSRDALRWKLTDIRLPLGTGAAEDPHEADRTGAGERR